MAKLNRDNQKGFTIVELVVVIIILGILAGNGFAEIYRRICRGSSCRGRRRSRADLGPALL